MIRESAEMLESNTYPLPEILTVKQLVNRVGSSACKTTLKIFLNRPQSEGGEETRESVSHKE